MIDYEHHSRHGEEEWHEYWGVPNLQQGQLLDLGPGSEWEKHQMILKAVGPELLWSLLSMDRTGAGAWRESSCKSPHKTSTQLSWDGSGEKDWGSRQAWAASISGTPTGGSGCVNPPNCADNRLSSVRWWSYAIRKHSAEAIFTEDKKENSICFRSKRKWGEWWRREMKWGWK